MSEHKCYLVERVDDPETGQWYLMPDGRRVRMSGLEPGAVWRSPQSVGGPEFWWVFCPAPEGDYWGGSPFCLDDRWNVTGTAPALTATPSLLIFLPKFRDGREIGRTTKYHGFLTNGMLVSTPDSPC